MDDRWWINIGWVDEWMDGCWVDRWMIGEWIDGWWWMGGWIEMEGWMGWWRLFSRGIGFLGCVNVRGVERVEFGIWGFGFSLVLSILLEWIVGFLYYFLRIFWVLGLSLWVRVLSFWFFFYVCRYLENRVWKVFFVYFVI